MEKEKELPKISEPAYEIAIGALQMQCKRLFILCIVIFAALIVTNAGWIIHESMYEDVVTETYTADTGSGGTAIATRDSEVTINGESDLHTDKDTP